MRLSDLAIRSLKAPERGQITYPDDLLPGFGLRVSPGGTKSFVLVVGGGCSRRCPVPAGCYSYRNRSDKR